MVIIRGGGDEVDFDVFNDLNVIDAWISLPSFRISAIGHSKDRTYLDIFSDRSYDTPTAAAVEIRKEIEKLRLEKELNQKNTRASGKAKHGKINYNSFTYPCYCYIPNQNFLDKNAYSTQ